MVKRKDVGSRRRCSEELKAEAVQILLDGHSAGGLHRGAGGQHEPAVEIERLEGKGLTGQRPIGRGEKAGRRHRAVQPA
ncbi:MAG: hypothetical protein KJZ87_24165 [Thermoguttaceae bacterium]|nr:hypothetical protein [Thermoguttaceae bacterium]